MTDLVTNADDVDVYITPATREMPVRLKANEFTITREQDINHAGEVGSNTAKGLTKGDIQLSFEFTIQGDHSRVPSDREITVADLFRDKTGDATPFRLEAEKKAQDDPDDTLWLHGIDTCLADTEEMSGTSGEALEVSVEGQGVGYLPLGNNVGNNRA